MNGSSQRDGGGGAPRGRAVFSATIFLIMELDRPYQGLINNSGAPMRAAMAQIGR